MKQDFAQFKAGFKELPAPLPAGERIIWQGKPGFKALAWRAFHIRDVAIYFGALLAWRVGSALAAAQSAADVAIAGLWIAAPAAASFCVLSLLAWLFARAACYTVTTKRVLFQFGVALPMTLNIPLDKIVSASLKTWRDGSGDIPLMLADNCGSWLLLWPHARPWRLRGAQPMLRAVPNAAHVAAQLAEALSGEAGHIALPVTPAAAPRAAAALHATPAAA